jgi:hypothetical protein
VSYKYFGKHVINIRMEAYQIPTDVVEQIPTHDPTEMACYSGKHNANTGVDTVALTSNMPVNYNYPSVFVMAEAILWCHEDFNEVFLVIS